MRALSPIRAAAASALVVTATLTVSVPVLASATATATAESGSATGSTATAERDMSAAAARRANLDEQNFAFILQDLRAQNSKEDPLETDACLTKAAKKVARKMKKTDAMQLANIDFVARQCGFESVVSVSQRASDLGKVYDFYRKGAALKVLTDPDHTSFGVGVTGKFNVMRYWALLIAEPLDDEPTETPTATPTTTATATASASPTEATSAPSETVTATPTGTPSESPTITATPTPSQTPSESPTVVTQSPTPTVSGTPTSGNPDAVEQRAMAIHNEIRINNPGRGLLDHDACLQRFADAQAQKQADEQRMHHQSLGPIFDACPIDYVGENVAYGYPSPEAVMDGWMNSPPHRENILRPEFNLVAVGVARGDDGRLYWATVFGRRNQIN